MAHLGARIDVRGPADGIRILDIRGDLTASAEAALSAAFAAASSRSWAILLNFSQVRSIDSLGAGLLIAMLARVRRRKRRLLAYGLSPHGRQALRVTRLDELLRLYADEAEALGSLGPAGLKVAPPSESPEARRSERPGRWAEPLDRLRVPPLPPEAINVNVEGRRPTGPVKGFGRLWRRTYSIRLVNAAVTPAEVVRVWKERFPSFWPPSGRFYGADKSVDAGDVAVLNLAGPMGLTLDTGIWVIYADDESFSFLSAEGHMFGGMITFSAKAEGGTTVAQVQALLRASDPLFEIAARLGLTTKPEDRFWQETLTNLAAHFGVEGQPVRQQAELLDRRLQPSEAGNVWYNGAIRSALHLLGQWLRRREAG